MKRFLSKILSSLREYRHRTYLDILVKRGLKIGKNTHIMDGAFLDPSHCFLISIGDNCTLAPNVRVIAHDASTKKSLGVAKIARVRILDNCFLGDSAIVLPGVSIGPNAVIGAGSVVTGDIPPGSVAAGNPAKVLTTTDEFLKKHQENRKKWRSFQEERYNIDVLTPEDREEMLSWLEKKPGYMEDDRQKNEPD
ncbi:MAG: acyltransferase [Nitrospiria bacterium]